MGERMVVRVGLALVIGSVVGSGCGSGDADELNVGGDEIPALRDRASNGAATVVPASLAFIAAHRAADELGLRQEMQGVVPTEDGAAFLFGSKEDFERLIDGLEAVDIMSAIIVGPRFDALPCQGVVHDVTDLADVGAQWSTCNVGLRWTDVIDAAAEEDARTIESDEPVGGLRGCNAVCGIDDRKTFAGVEAFSNGGVTGTGAGCTTNGSYGIRYQCVEWTDRVHRRPDWTGNAYTGYWSSATNGPYQKGLLPLISGNSIAPPLSGDIVVWSAGTYGHVGVLSQIGSTSTVIDQNRACGSQSCTVGYSTANGKYTLSKGNCFATASPVGYLRRGWDFSGAFGVASGSSSTNWWLTNMTYMSGTISGTNGDVGDYINLNPGATDPYMTSPKGLALPAYSASATHGYRKLVVSMKSACADKNAQLFWRRTTDSAFSEANSRKTTVSGSSWTTVVFDMTGHSGWSGTIDQIRIDPASKCSSGSTDTISLRYAYFAR